MILSGGGIYIPGGFAPSGSYDWTTDSRIIAWYEPDNGLVNKYAASPWGDLVQTGGTVPIGGGLNGHPGYQFTKGSSGWLVSTNTGAAARFYGPIHVIMIAKTGAGSNVAGDGWFSDPVNATPKYAWNSTAGARVFGSGSNYIVACTTANYNLHELYLHGSLSRFSVNGAAYSAIQNTGIDTKLSGLVMGAAASNGSSPANLECAFFLAFEGQMTEQFRAGLWAYLRAKFPSLSLPSTMPATFDIRPTDPSALLVPGAFDVLPYAGQSNASTYSTAATAVINSNILMLANDNTYKTMVAAYDNQTNHADTVSVEPAALGVGGEGGQLCNLVQARTGRTLVFVPGMLGSSFVVPGAIVPPQNFSWARSYPRGFRLRNSIYGSWVARTRDALARGGNYLFTGWDQGEAEGQSVQSTGDQWPAEFTALMNDFHADVGVTKRVVFVQISLASHGVNWANFRANTMPLAIAAGQVMASAPDGPYNVDGIHRQGSACDTTGTNIYNAAVSAGYL